METEAKFIEKIEEAIPNKDLKGWEKGKEYLVDVQKMWHGRYCIYKQVNHFREPSGHLVYDSLEEMANDFELVKKKIQIVNYK